MEATQEAWIPDQVGNDNIVAEAAATQNKRADTWVCPYRLCHPL
ncbi:MAG: hypothetical protein Q7T18_05320 [Sedimentisphaerales bacterium]|nr:hypothetical protein [Sedimentisphaerales bacterium]